MIYGYCRVSTKAQQKDGYSLEEQRKQILEKYPDAEVYMEAYTGTKLNRPIFDELISKMKTGDTLAVCKMDRFARNTQEGLLVIQNLFKRGIAVHIFNVGLLEDNPMGKFFITIMLSVAELERNQIIERTQTGRRAAREKALENGTLCYDHRPLKYTKEEVIEAMKYLKTHSYKETVLEFGISKSSLIRFNKIYGTESFDTYFNQPISKKSVEERQKERNIVKEHYKGYYSKKKTEEDRFDYYKNNYLDCENEELFKIEDI